MPDIRLFSLILLVVFIAACGHGDMDKTIRFDLTITPEQLTTKVGRSLSGQNTNGFVALSTPILDDGYVALYDHPGYEISIPNPSSVLWYFDKPPRGAGIIESSDFVFSDSALNQIKTPEQARAYLQSFIDQFQRGKWKRHIRDDCPRLVGRASVINEGLVDSLAKKEFRESGLFSNCTIDPAFSPPLDEWIRMASPSQGLHYSWRDDRGVIADLDFNADEPQADGTYGPYQPGTSPLSVNLSFELESAKKKQEQDQRARDLKERWGAEVAPTEAERRRIRDLLEEMAVQRGEALAER
jgi:hypothetical protein